MWRDGQGQAQVNEASNGAGSVRTMSRSETEKEEEIGALSQRLSDMTEQALNSAGKRAGKLLEESGFSEELKKSLRERIEASSFKAEHASAIAQANMPVGASRHDFLQGNCRFILELTASTRQAQARELD